MEVAGTCSGETPEGPVGCDGFTTKHTIRLSGDVILLVCKMCEEPSLLTPDHHNWNTLSQTIDYSKQIPKENK